MPLAILQELAQASTILTTGRAALQKRIMALLRKIELCTHGVIQAWEDTVMNWKGSPKHLSQYPKTKDEGDRPAELFHRVGKRRASHHSTEHELEDQVAELANMTGFLVALGGVCLQRKSSAGGRGKGEAKNKVVLKGSLPHAGCQDMLYCPVTQFLGHLPRLLVCSNKKFGPHIQKHVKDLVGHKMNSALYTVLFDQIKIIVKKFFNQTGQEVVNDTKTQFIEHIIFIMKNVLEAGGGKEGQAGTGQPGQSPLQAGNLVRTSIELMRLAIGRYVRHLNITFHALHIKTCLCQLVEAMMRPRDDLAFRQEMRFRNKMVEYLTDWCMGNRHQIASPAAGDGTAITQDRDEACMQAVAALLQGLPLQSKESDRGDLMEAKGQLFLKYFTLFLNLLNDCGEDGGTVVAGHEGKEEGAAGCLGHGQRQRQANTNKNSLRNATIQAMSNLLSANIDSGLMHSIGLGYHKDLQTRAAPYGGPHQDPATGHRV